MADLILSRTNSALVVSLAECKAYLRLERDDDDALLSGLVRTAMALCEAFTGQWLIVRDGEQRLASEGYWQRINVVPVVAITGVAVGGDLVPGTAFDSDIDLPGHVFSRIHVDDIAGAVLASMHGGPAGIYNIADDLPAPGEAVTAAAARMLGMAPSPLIPLAQATLSPMGRAFYAECRRVANGRMKRQLGYCLKYPDYHSGLLACFAEMQQ